MDSICLQEPPADLRRDRPRTTARKTIARLAAICALLIAGVAPVHAQNFKVGSFVKPASTAVLFVTSQTANTNSAATLTTPAITPGVAANGPTALLPRPILHALLGVRARYHEFLQKSPAISAGVAQS